jgi:subtilisin family serine protease
VNSPYRRAGAARAPAAITVGATTSTDARSGFSNHGSCLDLFAPGSTIASAWHTSDTATNTISGTSMASPHVAGAAALHLQANPTASPAQVASAITSTATTGVVASPGSGSPNRLLYTLGLGSGGTDPGPDPDPQPGTAVVNGGFEQGQTGWSSTSGVIGTSGYAARTGSWKAWLNGYGRSSADTVSQTVTVPSNGRLRFHLRVVSAEGTGTAYDTLRVQVVSGGGTSTLATYSNRDKSSGYVQRTVNLSAYSGQQVTLRFAGAEDSMLATSFLLDDISLATP